MIGLIFSLDLEVYGTGKGDFRELMLHPTERMLEIFERHGAKLTIMAEVAEILALRREPRFHSTLEAIEKQLQEAIAAGHDVQLHLHPAWFNARYEDSQWQLDFAEYALVDLPFERLAAYLNRGKAYLERLLRPVRSDYCCIAFRAGNWLIQPSSQVVRALEELGFRYDTSVFKHGFGRVGRYVLDYRHAYSEFRSWVVDPDDINCRAQRRGLAEIPILTREAPVTAMLTPRRILLQMKLRRGSAMDCSEDRKNKVPGTGKRVNRLRLRYPMKFDFCRLSFRQLKYFVQYARRRAAHDHEMIPVVAIGHSAEFLDDGTLDRFCAHVARLQPEVTWTTFSELAAHQRETPQQRPNEQLLCQKESNSSA